MNHPLISCLILLSLSLSLSVGKINLYESAHLSTSGNAGFEFFTINDEHFIASANFWNGISSDMSAYSTISKVIIDPISNLLKLTEKQRILTKGAHGVDVFSENDDINDKNRRIFLSIPNYYYCGSDRGPSNNLCNSTMIYIFDNTLNTFTLYQTLSTSGPAQTDHFIHDSSVYILVGENFNNEVCIYRLLTSVINSSFIKHQCLTVPGAGSTAIIKENNSYFLIASSYHDNGWKTKTRIYKADIKKGEEKNLSFREYQQFETNGCHDVEVGKFNSGTFVFLSEDRIESTSKIESSLLIFDPLSNSFKTHQKIPTDGAHAAELFQGPDNAVYLFIANFGDRLGKRYLSKSTLWRQDSTSLNGQFFKVDSVISYGATDVEHFVINNRHFLGLSNEGDIGNRLYQKSIFYELVVIEDSITEKTVDISIKEKETKEL